MQKRKTSETFWKPLALPKQHPADIRPDATFGTVKAGQVFHRKLRQEPFWDPTTRLRPERFAFRLPELVVVNFYMRFLREP